MLSHVIALEHDAVGVVNDPVENGVGVGRVCDQVMPFDHGPAWRGKVDVLDAGFAKAQPGRGEPVPDALVGPYSDLAVEHQAEPLVTAELVG